MTTKIFDSLTHIIIDPGHGIDTPGKRSPIWENGIQLLEWKFNRSIAKFLIEMLNNSNISYTLLVDSEKDVPLKKRVELANKLCKILKDKKSYLVSIHGNAADNPLANGIEIWTSKGKTKSDLLANYFYKELSNVGFAMRSGFNGELDREEDFYILKNTICPAVLTENGFYTNKEDCKKMLDETYQKRIALAHYRAIYTIEHENSIWK